jgi:hypothetical protein
MKIDENQQKSIKIDENRRNEATQNTLEPNFFRQQLMAKKKIG